MTDNYYYLWHHSNVSKMTSSFPYWTGAITGWLRNLIVSSVRTRLRESLPPARVAPGSL